MKPEWREVLECRSVLDKIAVPIDCDIAPVESIPAVSELVREGYVAHIDRCCLPKLVVTEVGMRIGMNVDVFQLTPKGIELCDANGIKRK